MKYRMKQPTVDAFQYDGDLKDRNGNYCVPDWAVEAFEKGLLYYHPQRDNQLVVREQNVSMLVEVGDYIVRDAKGYLYSSSPDAFEETYEPAE